MGEATICIGPNGSLHTLSRLHMRLTKHAALCPARSPGGAAGGAVALAGRRREVAALEAALAGRLDPIDWATYEPYLYANKERAAARSQVRSVSVCVCVYVWCGGAMRRTLPVGA